MRKLLNCSDANTYLCSLCLPILLLLTFQCTGSSAGFQEVLQPFPWKIQEASDYKTSDGFTFIQQIVFYDVDSTFTLGFMRKSLNAYTLSVWLDVPGFNKAFVVWSANRNQPVKANATVNFVANGSLAVNDSDGREVWSTHTDGRGGIGLRLQDSGNLVIYNALNKSVWQTFDFPTDTLLQGQVFSPGMRLISSVSQTNLSEGSYSLVMETGGLACLVSSPNPLPYWIWGYYGKNDTDSVKHTCQHPTQLSFSPSDPSDLRAGGVLSMFQAAETNLTGGSTSSILCNISASNPRLVFTNTFMSKFTRFLKIESDGNLRIYVYNGGLNVDYDFFPPDQQCRLPGKCGPYGLCSGASAQCSCPESFSLTNNSSPSQGCTPQHRDLQSSYPTNISYNNSTLMQLSGVDYFPHQFVPVSEQSALAKANCEDLCLQNSSCTASFFYGSSNSCFILTDPLQTLQIVPDQTKLGFIKVQAYRPPVSIPTTKKRQSHSPAQLVGGVIGTVTAVCAFVLASFWYRRKTKTKTDLSRNSTEDDSFMEMLPGILTRFSYDELHAATLGFKKELGAGGFGSVYEGSLRDGTQIAVKKLEGAKQGQKEFRAEVATIGSIHHINLVRLHGFCSEGLDRLLVYEYMPNGSLDTWLFAEDKSCSTMLNWQRRFQIALGTARGLAYLHDECRERIIHLDIKPQNILLDDTFLPKVADFGLSKLVDRNKSMVYTTMRGTPGYLAPEWLLHAAVTDKTDVYSYGMVLLELVTGHKAFDFKCTEPEKQYLPAWVVYEIQLGRMMEVVDKRLHGDVGNEEVELLINIAYLCLKEEMEMRPSMATVVQMLEGRVLVPPPTFEEYRFVGRKKILDSFSLSQTHVNTITISTTQTH